MATGKDLEALAGEEWNPYYLAYAIDVGAKDPKETFARDKGNHNFFAWNNARWRDTLARLGEKGAKGWGTHEIIGFYSHSKPGQDAHLETLALHLGAKLDERLQSTA